MGLKVITAGRDRRETGEKPAYQCANCKCTRYNPCACAKKSDKPGVVKVSK